MLPEPVMALAAVDCEIKVTIPPEADVPEVLIELNDSAPFADTTTVCPFAETDPREVGPVEPMTIGAKFDETFDKVTIEEALEKELSPPPGS